MSSSAGVAEGRRKPWPRVHLVYFLLAAFDLLAVAGGLYLSHRVIQVFESNIEANARVDRSLTSSWAVSDTMSEANAAVIGAFEAADTKQARDVFHSKHYEVQQELEILRKDIAARFPVAAARRADAIIGKIELLKVAIKADAEKVFSLLDLGDHAKSVRALAAMQRRQATLRFQLKDLNRLVSMVKVGKSEGDKKTVAGLRGYEYGIAGMIGLMVACVAFYGHWLGRLMRRKYEDLQAAQTEAENSAAELQGVNDSISALNVELAANMRKLKAAQDEIVRRGRLAQLGQLTATVAHELRNPMGAIRTSAYLLERKTRGLGLGVDSQLERINNGIARCDGIITQLLDFARSQALQRESVAFDDWLQSLVEEEAEKLPAAVAVECHFGLAGRQVEIDAQRMARVFINLISNAAEAMVGKGNDPSRFATPEPKLSIETRMTHRGVEVVVSDNGPGITAENLARILEPLFTTKTFGTGLGLPAAEKVLQQHAGGLEVESRPGEGARFTAWFPVKEAVEQAA